MPDLGKNIGVRHADFIIMNLFFGMVSAAIDIGTVWK